MVEISFWAGGAWGSLSKLIGKDLKSVKMEPTILPPPILNNGNSSHTESWIN